MVIDAAGSMAAIKQDFRMVKGGGKEQGEQAPLKGELAREA